jgi:NADH-quinone oxidoreductase subunit J
MMLAALAPNYLAFSLLATLCILSALGVVISKNAIWSALSLVATFFLVAILYFTLEANMLAITQVVVYAGAIMVLFLFILMVLNVGKVPAEKKDYKTWVAGVCGLSLFGVIAAQLFAAMSGSDAPTNAPAGYGSPRSLGAVLFTTYAYPFEAVSILLLIGIVGSILLAKRRLH